MKRLFTIILSALIILSPLSAFDFGGYFDNNSKISAPFGSDLSFDQANSIALWISSPINENFYIKAEGTYKFSYNYPSNNITHIADLDLLKISGTIPLSKGSIDLAFGRFIYSDLTNTIFSQNCDGVSFKYSTPSLAVSAYAGFTGLLNSNAVTILTETGKFTPKNEIYALNAFYVPVVASVSLPMLFLNQTLAFQASGFVDVTGDLYNRVYATVDLSGPLATFLFYDFSTTFGTENFKNVMNYSNLSFSIFPTNNIYISTGVIYASGDHLGLKPFRGFSSHPVASEISLEASNCLIPSLSANISLLQSKMLVSVTGKGVFQFAADSIDATGIQGDASVIYNIFPDFQVGLSGTVFKGFKDTSLDKFSATVKFAITF